MPRRSAEARAATFWQKSAGPPKAPRYLSPPARKLWKGIILLRRTISSCPEVFNYSNSSVK